MCQARGRLHFFGDGLGVGELVWIRGVGGLKPTLQFYDTRSPFYFRHSFAFYWGRDKLQVMGLAESVG